MSPSAPKRRKLEHSRTSADGAESFDSEGSDLSAQEDAPIPTKSVAVKPKRSQEDADQAIYSGGLFKSSMFKLQVDEMLAEVQPSYEKRLSGVNEALKKLKEHIESIGDRGPASIVEARQFLQKSYKISPPYPNPPPKDDANYKLTYSRPANINVVGSYVSRTMVKAETLAVDMVVVMPASIFQEKDYLDYRYFYKRAYYLACMTGALQEAAKDDFTFCYEYMGDNDLQPILIVAPRDVKSAGWEIRVIPSAPSDVFSPSNLFPSKCCIRSADAEKQKVNPTPFYNASIEADLSYLLYLKRFHMVAKQAEGFRDGCILGRIWLRQRGFASSMACGGFGHFEWAAIMALLLEGGGAKGQSAIAPGYSSYQMFRAVLQFLSTTDLSSKPLIHKATGFPVTKSDAPTLFDGPRNQNLLFKMTPWSYTTLRNEATSTLTMLNDVAFDQFDSTFITRVAQPLQRYDCIVRIALPTQYPRSSADHSTSDTFSRNVYSVLRKGLEDRIRLVYLHQPGHGKWSIKSPGPKAAMDGMLDVCVIFDPANISRVVDHGPPAEDKKAAAEFQKFWGEKAELRRFKDGSILESLVWSGGSSYSIFQEIVTYLVSKHFGASVASKLSLIGNHFEKLVTKVAGSKNSFDELRTVYSDLERTLRGLEGLPLQLRQLSPISPQLRGTSLDIPQFSSSSPLPKPADVLLQFEGSGRWPDDMVAIQRTKIAFLLKTGELLEEAVDSLKTRLGLENEDDNMQNCAFLDVIYESGATFRIRIHTEREQSLLEKAAKDKLSPNHIREEAALALAEYKCAAAQLPLLHQSIATHCTRFPVLGSSIRLLKLWLSKHMLLGHVTEELAELLTVRTFLQPYPWSPPTSAMTAFLRTLQWISRWDWQQSPLVVDFNGTMTAADVSSFNTRVEAWRNIDPSMNKTVLIAASNHDSTGTAFTALGPSKVVAARLSGLARAACNVIRDQGINLDPRLLFASSNGDYDFLIHIAPNFAAGKQEKKGSQSKYKNLEVQTVANVGLIGFNAVKQYLRELTELYGDSIVFFHNANQESIIAGVWNPQQTTPRSFRVNLGYASKVVTHEEDTCVVVIDQTTILSEMARLGGDMVTRIDVKLSTS